MIMYKTNEVPEKIYVHKSQYWGLMANEDKTTKNDIEYTRTDVFIENTEKYLKTQFIKDVSVLTAGSVNINFSTAIENFVNYMKGL